MYRCEKEKEKRLKKSQWVFVLFCLFFGTMSVSSYGHAESQVVHGVVGETGMKIKKPKGKPFCRKVFLISISDRYYFLPESDKPYIPAL